MAILIVALPTQGSGLDTILAVYTGSSVRSLIGVAGSDDAGGGTWSTVSFPVAEGLPIAWR